MKQYEPGWDMKAPIIAIILAITIMGVFFPQWLDMMLKAIIRDLRLGT
jgi:hypothetical protein